MNEKLEAKKHFELAKMFLQDGSVEKAIEDTSGEYNRTELWKNLPKKVMWQTFLVILEYLENINKIAFDRDGKIAYIWNPDLAKRLRIRKEVKVW